MINLLPQEKKADIKHAYFMRLGIVACIMAALLVIVATAFLMPSYFIASVNEKIVKAELAALSSSRDPELQSVTSEVQTANKELARLSTEQSASLPLDIISPAVDQKNSGIHITSISYEKGDAYTLMLRGNASTRDTLLEYVRKLDEQDLYEDIEVPINNLLREENVDFNLELVKKK